MKIKNFSFYEKSYKKVYALVTVNVCDKSQYFTTKKEGIKAFNKECRFYPNYEHSLDLLIWDEHSQYYDNFEIVCSNY